MISGEKRVAEASLILALSDIARVGAGLSDQPLRGFPRRYYTEVVNHFVSAWQWVMETRPADVPFATCCEAMDLEPSGVRHKALRAMADQEFAARMLERLNHLRNADLRVPGMLTLAVTGTQAA